ncbi:Uu.00g064280.m01.CDS01 [Anthostomella pinea]|uniref:Uu.00g064280.m01.CDS01 n=1 Tax=Anthostomella pinea TaxID=933095 RepID=A0AAI8YN21_9PEZI|nr:Uu.00g064280.m01.CDS01 [Anthostomella pinea]
MSPPATESEDPMARLPPNLVARFTQALKTYQLSNSTFRVLCSLPATPAPTHAAASLDTRSVLTPLPPHHPTKSILVLDSSFNPPTLAHQRMALSALADPRYGGAGEDSEDGRQQSRLLLLLAINNADKAPKPAAFPQRLAMMYVFAQDLLAAAAAATTTQNQEEYCNGNEGERDESTPGRSPPGCAAVDIAVDIAVTTEPYFHAKSNAISTCDFYRGTTLATSSTTTTTSHTSSRQEAHQQQSQQSPQAPEQIYLTGFDTLIRIFDPKYYPSAADGGIASALDPFFAHARLRVTTRPDPSWGDVPAQRAYLARLRDGELTRMGGRAEWADRVEMVDGGEGEEEETAVSSTKVRDAVLRADWEALGRLVSPGVRAWVRGQGLYGEGEGEGEDGAR